MKLILLTVPHYTCPSIQEGHQCDYGARIAYKLLIISLIEKDFEVIVVIGDVMRFACDFCDLNRKPSRKLRFRKVVTKLFEEEKLDFLYDVHSFNADYEKWKMFELVILDSTVGPKKQLPSFLLYKFLKANKIKVKLFLTGLVNDIMDEAHEKAVKGFLIEFNEGLKIKRATKITDLIATWTDKFLNTPIPLKVADVKLPEKKSQVGNPSLELVT